MKRIYKISYEYKMIGCGDYLDGQNNVLANGDAQKAVDKVKSHVLKDEANTDFRLQEVRILGQTDL
ncbi:MAG: hypothetical protein MJA83_10235 [Gammaproteobacteria bacterium]|nr:hypothetical protein [Gammaproteobacteria bacterium]